MSPNILRAQDGFQDPGRSAPSVSGVEGGEACLGARVSCAVPKPAISAIHQEHVRKAPPGPHPQSSRIFFLSHFLISVIPAGTSETRDGLRQVPSGESFCPRV